MDTASIITLIVAIAFIGFICYKIFKKDYSNGIVNPPSIQPPVINPGTYPEPDPSTQPGPGPEEGDPDAPVNPYNPHVHPTPEHWENPDIPNQQEDEIQH